ncbi:hypothetical protein HWD28_gp108 [Salmonella phage atrejo]|uniref:Uncharacterized protein n=2 Tax=Viruses TaxID=10239 RepID=A0A6G8RKF3_9CAUD|nr:hypothetical protein HWD28_gp108 [Salmonella phage atrejo]QIO01810.1 hypothetical protein atrejo_162 [Salmonella phage atrejo]
MFWPFVYIMRDKINELLYEEALQFPINRFTKSDGSINRTKLKQLHPDFQQDALNLIFIRRAVEAHGKFFGYERVKYRTMQQQVEIYCPDHDGYFLQTARSHLEGHGCRLCAHKVVTRLTEYGVYTVPAPFHKFVVDGEHIIWYNKDQKLKQELKKDGVRSLVKPISSTLPQTVQDDVGKE